MGYHGSRKFMTNTTSAALSAASGETTDETHRLIQTACKEGIAEEGFAATAYLQARSEGIKAIKAVSPENHIADASRAALSTVNAMFGGVEDAREKEATARDELARFKTKNNIERPARNPNRALALLLLVAVLTVEVFAGTLLYADASNNLFEAFLKALVISASITSAALFMGVVGLSYAFNSSRGDLRWWIGVLVSITMGLTLSVLVVVAAHDRDRLASFDSNTAVTQARDQILPLNPVNAMTFHTVHGYGFQALLLVLAFLAVLKGYNGFSDPIPGYARYVERWENAKRDVDEKLDELRMKAMEPFAAERRKLTDMLTANNNTVETAEHLANEADAREKQYRDACASMVERANAKICLVQEAYAAVRQEKPAYFDTQYLSEEKDVPELTITAEAVRSKAHQRAIEAEVAAHLIVDLQRKLNLIEVACMRSLEGDIASFAELALRAGFRERNANPNKELANA